MKTNYLKFYEELTKNYQTDEKKKLLRLCNKIVTNTYYVVYPLLLLYLFVKQSEKLLPTILIPLFSIVAITLLRKVLARPRPYEEYPIDQILEKETQHNAMPSRHVFSASIIAMMCFSASPILACILLVLAAIEGYIRVVGGVHYPRDVIVGYLLGVFFGLFIL